MLKRCHSLKKSNLKIKCSPQSTSISRSYKSIQSTEEDQECPIIQSTYTCPSPQIKLTNSCVILNQYSSEIPQVIQRPKNDLNNKKDALEKIKLLCKNIEEIENKIEGYKEMSKRREVRHAKEMNSKCEEKEKKLSLLIEIFQMEKSRGSGLIHELMKLGIKENEEMLLEEISLNRRTTATFNYE